MGQIIIKTPKQDRMLAISNLAKAVYELSKALSQTAARVTVQNCTISTNDVGINIGLEENPPNETVVDVKDD